MEKHLQDGQQDIDINASLDKLAEVLQALGVDEFTIEDDYQYHLVRTDDKVNARLQDMFRQSVERLYEEIVKGGRKV